ncbi:hypothetical protein WA171_001835, partial [Blastocystis sp. BT1]
GQTTTLQATFIPDHVYLVLQFEGFRPSDISTGPLIYQILSSSLNYVFGGIGSAKHQFSIVAFKDTYLILQVQLDTCDVFVGALALCCQWNGEPCRISCLGTYPTVLSASHKVSSLLLSS